MSEHLNLPSMLNEAVLHLQSGRFSPAELMLQQIILHWPGQPDACHLLGICAYQQDDFNAAAIWLEQAVRAAPEVPEFRLNQGNALRRTGQVDLARDAYLAALHLRPNFVPAHRALAELQREQRCFSEAASQFECAAECEPDNSDAWATAGEMWLMAGEHAAAIKSLQRAVALQPENCKLWNNLGVALSQPGFLSQGLAAFKRAAEIDPEYVRALGNYANALRDAGLGELAMETFRHLIARAPRDSLIRSNALFSSLYSEQIRPEDVLALHRRFDLEVVGVPAEQSPAAGCASSPLGGVPIRIAYLSPDFRNHPVAYFIDGVLRHHDAVAVEVFLYSNSLTQDDWSRCLQSRGWQWRDISGDTDDDLQRLVREDRIEILVDLSGHTAYNRMTAVARRLAPVQIHYLGYPFSTGISAIDFRITDDVVDPPGSAHLASEQLIRLSRSYYAYSPPDFVPAVSPLPMEEDGEPAFGVCSNLAKVSPLTLDRWATLLLALPNARLLWRAKAFGDQATAQRMLDEMTCRGVVSSRVTLEPWTESSGRWEIFSRMDIALDTFPYNQATNTCEALWMGVPTLTQLGDSHQARMGASIMQAAGMFNFVASSPADWVAVGVARAMDKEGLARLRAGMREHLKTTPLLDVAGLVCELEKIYQKVRK